MGYAYNEFGYNKHPAITSKSPYFKIINNSITKFSGNEY